MFVVEVAIQDWSVLTMDARIVLIGAGLALSSAAASHGQTEPTLQIWADTGTEYANYRAVPLGTAWDLVVTLSSPGQSVAGVDFTFPGPPAGAVVVDVQYPAGNSANSGAAEEGRYLIDFGGCAAPCARREVLRVTYVAFAAEIPQNTLLELHGPTGPESIPVLRDCEGTEHQAPMGGTSGGTTCEVRIDVPPGAAVLNPAIEACVLRRGYFMESAPYENCEAVVETSAGSISMLKFQF